MRKIFHFDSPADQYVADAAVLCCFDHRISTVVRKFLKKQGIERADMIIVAGGAKTLASPRNDFEQDFILEQVRMSIRGPRSAVGLAPQNGSGQHKSKQRHPSGQS